MVTQQEYQLRRYQLAQLLPQGAIAIIAAAVEILRNGDSHYPFRQASNFYYLTGFNEPEAILVIVADSKESYLFNRPSDLVKEQWTGKRLGQEGACQLLGMHKAFSIDSLSNQLPKLLADKSAIYYAIGHIQLDNLIIGTLQSLKTQVRRGINVPKTLYDIEPLISEMRLFKSSAEIASLRQAIDISVLAHKHVMQTCRRLDNEYKLEAELLYELSRYGCRNVAYNPVIGSGANACVLHYTNNNSPLKQGELVLVDAGGEYDNYAADITRTFPVTGRFSQIQRDIYGLVLSAQQAGIGCIKPGIPWDLIQQNIVNVLTQGLCELGLLQGDIATLIANESYKSFYWHSSGHWLGLDVHDSGCYKQNNGWRLLEPGMVLTVEPGLYINPNVAGVDECWWNIGIRIEDDILVTNDGYENLSSALPRTINDIEALMSD